MLVREGVVGSVDEDERIRLVDWLNFFFIWGRKRRRGV